MNATNLFKKAKQIQMSLDNNMIYISQFVHFYQVADFGV